MASPKIQCGYWWLSDTPCRHHTGNAKSARRHKCHEVVVLSLKEYELALAAGPQKRAALIDEAVRKKHPKHECTCGEKKRGWKN